MNQRQRSVVLVSAVALGACDLVEPSGCDVCTTSAVVYGQVRDATGAPVTGARLQVEAYHTDAGRGPADLVVGSTSGASRTDATGRYRDQPVALAAPFRARLVVRVTPPTSSGLAEAVVTGAQVQFRDDYRGPARDSVRVDVVLSPGAGR